jgi:hypothetical protein
MTNSTSPTSPKSRSNCCSYYDSFGHDICPECGFSFEEEKESCWDVEERRITEKKIEWVA